MEHCIVCLEASEDCNSRITVMSSEWTKGNILRVIEKHLWWWYLKPLPRDNGVGQWICRQCWHEISIFHHFYNKVERAHRRYHSIITFSQRQNKTVIDKPTIKKEPDMCEEFLSIDAEDVKMAFHYSSSDSDTIESVSKNNYSETDSNSNKFEGISINSFDMQSVEYDSAIKKLNVQKKTKRKTNTSDREKKQQKQMDVDITRTTANSDDGASDILIATQSELQCCLCNAPLQDFRSLRVHFRTAHHKTGYALCCGYKFYRRGLYYDHLKVHTDPNIFKCQSCQKICSSRRTLKFHLETHEKRERIYKCNDCDKSFFSMLIFTRHKLTHVSESEMKFNCSQCNKKFPTDNARRQHVNISHLKKTNCEICSKSFCNMYTFLRHRHDNLPAYMVKCSICGINAINRRMFGQHLKRQHSEQTFLEPLCPYCLKVSPDFPTHHRHIKYDHKHTCRLCDKGFQRSVELKQHVCTRAGEAIHLCPHCVRKFKSNVIMQAHKKMAHPEEWEKERLQ